MTNLFKLNMKRYLPAEEFASDLKHLKAYRGSFISSSFLDALDIDGLLRPKLRLVWPDPVARRMWLEDHDYVSVMEEDVEPDSARWEAAKRLSDCLFRYNNRQIYGEYSHPFDMKDSDYIEFLLRPSDDKFYSEVGKKLNLSNDVDGSLYQYNRIKNYYSGWQILTAAEIVDIGIHIRLNMADAETAQVARHMIRQGNIPDGRIFEFFDPAHALRNFHKHEATLDAIVWSMEEAEESLNRILKNQESRRYVLTKEQSLAYHEAKLEAARYGLERHNVGIQEIISGCKFLAERWSSWNSDGRPRIAEAYKIYLGAAVRILKMTAGMTFGDISKAVARSF